MCSVTEVLHFLDGVSHTISQITPFRMLQTAQTGWTGFSSLTPISRSEPGQTSYLQQLPVSAHLSIMAGPKPINPTIAVMKG